MAKYFPDLVEEYKETLANVKASGGDLGMQRELKEAITWMETGYDPAEYRAATRTDAFVMDHHLMQDLISYVDSDAYVPKKDESASDEEQWNISTMKKKIQYALDGLTKNERAVFIMIRAEYMTYAQTAKVLGVSRSSVQSYLERAERKIATNVDYQGSSWVCAV